MNASISAIGMAVPAKLITNQYFESIIDTNDEWIVSRTGIHTRYHTEQDEYTSDLCVRAVQNLVDTYKSDLSDVDMIIVATVSPDQPMPSMACVLQHKMKMPRAGAFDLYGACAGFVYGIVVAKGLIAAGSHRKVLVLGAETLSKLTDFSDRTSCVLFGDGAGAVLIEAGTEGNIGASVTGANGENGLDLYISGFADKLDGQPIIKNQKIVQNGRKVFKWAINTVTTQIKVLLERNNLTLDDIDWMVPHSANMRILEGICNETGFPLSKVLESISEYGNTSSASIPLALCKGIREGKLKKGDKIILFGFGGGLTYAATLIVWPG
jgi:3-oxoacyl-[acyl-carrier-protein] synthase-3